MEEKIFLDKMMDLLDLDTPPLLTDSLDDFEEWDSLAYVSFLSLAKKTVEKRIPHKKVADAKTIGDLFALLQKED